MTIIEALMHGEQPDRGRPLTEAASGPERSVSSVEAGQPGRQDADEEPVLLDFVLEFLAEAKQTAMSVFCLAAFIVAYTGLFLKENLLSGPIVLYLAVAVVGLSFFALGIRYGLMPLGELVGARLPLKCSMLVVYAAVFALGVLCTIAEPAIGALQTAGEHTNRARAPLLAVVLDSPFSLMVAVGVGVGGAAMFGTVRVVLGWGIKPCVYVTCAPSIAITLCLVAPPGDRLPALTGLAWDCGAVTTGPVTVPIVLALGLGVAAASKKSQGAAANAVAIERERLQRKSLQPRWSSSRYSEGTQRSLARMVGEEEVVPQAALDPDDGEADLSGSGIVTFASLFPVVTVWALSLMSYGGTPESRDSAEAASEKNISDLAVNALEGTMRAIVPLVGFLLTLQLGVIRERIPNPKTMMWGMGFCLVGMFIFSVGLDGALTPLGQQAGKALPSATDTYGDFLGAVVIFAFAFLSGFIATFAEPALAALGETVEKNTKGKFGKFKLIFAVAIGVGLGIVLGMMKVFYELPLWPILTIGYSLNMVLTHFADDVVASIAWDSAGVTTGPVTVPIVLASGLALGRKKLVAEGFGILTCASIMPICAVLVSGLLSARGGVPRSRSSAPARAASSSGGGGVAAPRAGSGVELSAVPAASADARDQGVSSTADMPEQPVNSIYTADDVQGR